MSDDEAPLPEGWQQVLDPNTNTHYYCNTALGITQWHRPEETNTTAPAPAAAIDAQPSSSRTQEGWFYRDAFGVEQGPFTQEQLKEWRAYLPMDMLVTYRSRSSSGDDSEDQMTTELAELVGDGELLSSWRKHPAQKGPIAPPAPAWAHWLDSRKALAAAAAANLASASASSFSSAAASTSRPESFNSYAEAAIAGLSPTDEAVQIAHLAAASGKTIQDLLDFNYASGSSRGGAASGGTTQQRPEGYLPADRVEGEGEEEVVELPAVEGEEVEAHTRYNPDTGDYNFCADYDPRQRRLVSKEKEPQGPQALYGELMRWCDPAELERSLQEAAKRKGKPVPPAVWKKLKERKQQMKRKATAAWLAN